MLKNLFKKFFNVIVGHLSPEVQKWLSDTLFAVADWIVKSFKPFFAKWFPWLAGGSTAGYIGVSAAQNLYNDALEKFGFFARLIHLDDLFSTIDGWLVGTAWQDSCNMTFSQVMSAFGVVGNINLLLNAIGIAILWAIAFWVIKTFSSLIPFLIALVVK